MGAPALADNRPNWRSRSVAARRTAAATHFPFRPIRLGCTFAAHAPPSYHSLSRCRLGNDSGIHGFVPGPELILRCDAPMLSDVIKTRQRAEQDMKSQQHWRLPVNPLGHALQNNSATAEENAGADAIHRVGNAS